jgi:hypothetical protein
LNVADSSKHEINLATGGKLPECPTSLTDSTPALGSPSKAAPPAATNPPAAATNPPSAINPPAATNPPAANNGGSVTGNFDGYAVALGVTKPSDSKNNTASNIQKSVAAANTVATTIASVATGAANGTLITAFGYSCRDSHDVAHLVSTNPIAIGVKVVAVGHFTHDRHVFGIPTGIPSKPTDFTWDLVATPPKFTNAK